VIGHKIEEVLREQGILVPAGHHWLRGVLLTAGRLPGGVTSLSWRILTTGTLLFSGTVFAESKFFVEILSTIHIEIAKITYFCVI
jgi:hypothetical protein